MSDKVLKQLQEEIANMKLEREQANLRFKVFQDQVSGKLDPQSVHYFKGSHNDSDDDDNHSISSIHSSR